MGLSPAELLEEVNARGADIAVAGHEGIRVEFRQRLPESLQNEIKARAAELRSYLDGLRYEAWFKHELERCEAIYRSGDIHDIIRANRYHDEDLDKLRKKLASCKRALVKAEKGADSEQVMILSSQISNIENYVERYSRRVKCGEDIIRLVREKIPDI